MTTPPTPPNPGTMPPSPLGMPTSASIPPGPPPRAYYRRRSLFPALLLILIGAVLLANNLRPTFDLGYILTHYWPVLIILWGVSKLIDHFLHRPGLAPPAILTGGEAVLIILLLVITGFVGVGTWVRQRIPGDLINQITPFMRTTSQDFQADSPAIAPGSRIEISSPNGNITVRGGSSNAIHAVAHASVSAPTDDQAHRTLSGAEISVTQSNGVWIVRPATDHLDKNFTIALEVDVPAHSIITVEARRGDANVSGIRGDVSIPTQIHHLKMHDIAGNVSVSATDGDSHIRNVSGSVTLAGRGNGDLEIVNVQGSASVTGNLHGNMHFAAVAKNVHYQSQQTTVDVGGLPGEITIPDVQITQATGGATISTQNRDIRLNGIDGPLTVNDVHGDIIVTYSVPPKAAISLIDNSGDITLSLPSRSSFTLSAESKSGGDIENQFTAASQFSSDEHGPRHLEASYGSGSPPIHISTNYGNIHLRKSD